MKIGEKIVYPMHGAGEIVGIEDQEFGGEKKSYYVLRLPMGNLKLMLPVDKVEELGLREIIGKEKISEVAEVLSGKAEKNVGSWNKRFHANLDRMKSGDILDVSAVARNLEKQNLKKKLASGESRILDLARQILVSELIFVLDKTDAEVSAWVDEQIFSKKTSKSETETDSAVDAE